MKGLGLVTAVAGAAVTSIETFKHWTAIVDGFDRDTDSMFTAYITPWCRLCRQLLPEFDVTEEVFSSWDRSLFHRVYFSTLDCDNNKLRCGKLGLYSFPSLVLYDRRADFVAELPDYPRRAEFILPFLAWHKRVQEPIITTDDADFREKRAAFVDGCGGEARPVKQWDGPYAICRALRNRKVMTGTNATITKFNKLFPNSRSVFFQMTVERPVPGWLPSTDDICIADPSGVDGPKCIENFLARPARDTVEECKDWQRENQKRSVIVDGDWDALFRMRLNEENKMLVLAITEDVETLKDTIRNRTGWYGLTWTPEFHDKEHMLDQLGHSTLGPTTYVALHPSIDNKRFYVKNDDHISLGQWLDQIDAKLVPPSFPPGYELGFVPWVKREWKDLKRACRNIVHNMPLIGYVKIAAVASLALGSWIVLVYLTKDDENLCQPITIARKPAHKTTNAADEATKPDDEASKPDDEARKPDDEARIPDDEARKPDDKTTNAADEDKNKTSKEDGEDALPTKEDMSDQEEAGVRRRRHIIRDDG